MAKGLSTWRGALIAGVVGFAVAFGMAAYRWMAEPGLEETMAQAAEELRLQLPQRVDEVTEWTSVEAEGTTFTYVYTLDGPAAEWDPAGVEQARPGVVAGACGNEGMARSLEAGATYVYRYVGTDGAPVGEFALTQADCAAG